MVMSYYIFFKGYVCLRGYYFPIGLPWQWQGRKFGAGLAPSRDHTAKCLLSRGSTPPFMYSVSSHFR